MSIYDNRICKYCGKTFSGGPTACYCPDCRRIRTAERAKKYRSNPPERKLGSIDVCQNCGEKYIVSAGTQKYCKKCAPEMAKKNDAEKSLVYYKKNKDKINPKRYEERKGVEKKCVICGKLFYAPNRTKCCSDECRKDYYNGNLRNIYDKRRNK